VAATLRAGVTLLVLTVCVSCAGSDPVEPADPAPQVSFEERIIASGFWGAISVTSADMYEDGDVDVLGAAFRGNRIAWWENTYR
jgi:hypothetical protein